jgi:deoxyribose-phosphate aldolase
MNNLHRYIDHTLLKPEASLGQIEKIINEAKDYNFFSVCINSYFVKKASNLLQNSNTKVCTVVGFPLGASTMETKRFEAMKAIADGAREVDMVVNISAIKSLDWQYVLDDMASLAQVCRQQNTLLKVILETCLLTDEEKRKVCELALKAKVDFVKTSTGFSTSGATLDDIKLMKSIVGDQCGIKASGGIKSLEIAESMIQAGATRLGTSASVEIMRGISSNSRY